MEVSQFLARQYDDSKSVYSFDISVNKIVTKKRLFEGLTDKLTSNGERFLF